MIEMELVRIQIDEKRDGQVIVLKEKDGKRALPIIIGIQEVFAIKRKIDGIEPPRPMTHDLFIDVITKIGITIEKVIINKLAYNTFYAKLILKALDGKIYEIDSRPSDAIAIAVRQQTPIFVEEDVLNQIKEFEDQNPL